jgi:hypothetical protein
MRPALLIVSLLILSNCMPKLVLRENELPVQPADDLLWFDSDTTITGTVRMLSPKMQALDLVEIRGDSFPSGADAFRIGRVIFDLPIAPYYGGIIEARVRPVEQRITGYMLSAELLEWKEYPVNRELTRESLDRLLRQHGRVFKDLLNELGFEKWEPDAGLQLEGYDPAKDICIYSMVGERVMEGIVEKQPMLIVWATPEGKLIHVALTAARRVYERR